MHAATSMWQQLIMYDYISSEMTSKSPLACKYIFRPPWLGKLRDNLRQAVLHAKSVIVVDHEPSGPHKNAVFELLILCVAGLEKDSSSAVAHMTQYPTPIGHTSNPPETTNYQYSQFFWFSRSVTTWCVVFLRTNSAKRSGGPNPFKHSFDLRCDENDASVLE